MKFIALLCSGGQERMLLVIESRLLRCHWGPAPPSQIWPPSVFWYPPTKQGIRHPTQNSREFGISMEKVASIQIIRITSVMAPLCKVTIQQAPETLITVSLLAFC